MKLTGLLRIQLERLSTSACLYQTSLYPTRRSQAQRAPTQCLPRLPLSLSSGSLVLTRRLCKKLNYKVQEMKGMLPSIPCSVCNESGHRSSKCRELWSNTTPPPQKGDHDHDEDCLVLTMETICGNSTAHVFSHSKGSRAGHLKERSVIRM